MKAWCIMRRILILAVTILLGFFKAAGLSYEVPQDDSRAKFLYVFGSEGNPDYGADDVDHTQELYIDIPASETKPITIGIYDPDTGGFHDLKSDTGKLWGTRVNFQIYGSGDRLLGEKTFGLSPEYDRKVFVFGPYNKEKGAKIGDLYRFRLVASALEGNSQNLFSVRVAPETAQTFGEKISFRLLPRSGEEMSFYPEIPSGVSEIIVENYDIDPNGGDCQIIDPIDASSYSIKGSDTAEWAQTPINIVASKDQRRLIYRVTKKNQRYANAALRVKDNRGNILPIYFSGGRPSVVVRSKPLGPKPEITCNRFTFDGRKSYDPNGDKLLYSWDFGDGGTSTEPVVTHTYKDPGEYKVELTVRNNSGLLCDSSSSTKIIEVNTPPQVEFSSPGQACMGEKVTFDASDTVVRGGRASYYWDFGNGMTAKGEKATTVYKRGGDYQVKLFVDDNNNTTCSTGELIKKISINTPPEANAGKDIDICFPVGEKLNVTFYGSASSDSDGDGLSYSWDFGDGSSGNGVRTTHTYSKSGVYTATLTVNDGRGLSCSEQSRSVTVVLNQEPIAHAGEDIDICVGRTVTFDASDSLVPEQDIASYLWKFGDGTSPRRGKTVSHSYKKGGKYTATLTVDDGMSSKCSVSQDSLKVNVNTIPNAVLVNKAKECVGENVSFDASGSHDSDNDVLEYVWDFGDEVVKDGPSKITHAYRKSGDYTVSVRVGDGQGSDCSWAVAESSIRINTPPVADAGPNMVCCTVVESIFDGTKSRDADGDSLSYHWDFGDGSTARGEWVKHVYTKPGTYTAILKVDDNSGTDCSSSTSSFTAKVKEHPVSIIKVR